MYDRWCDHVRPICDRLRFGIAPVKPQSHRAYGQVTEKCWNRGQIVERTYDWSQRSWVVARAKSVAARSMVMFKGVLGGTTSRSLVSMPGEVKYSTSPHWKCPANYNTRNGLRKNIGQKKILRILNITSFCSRFINHIYNYRMLKNKLTTYR